MLHKSKFVQKVAVVNVTGAINFMVDNDIIELDIADKFNKGDIVDFNNNRFKIVEVVVKFKVYTNDTIITEYEYGVLSNDKNVVNIVFDDDKLKSKHPLLYKLMFGDIKDNKERQEILKKVKVPYTAIEWVDIVNELEKENIYYIDKKSGLVMINS